ncbi:MAG: acetate kinase [Lachnospiraceae bacterium]|nr:acetate kinase [Lachnospiraceae bacterium]
MKVLVINCGSSSLKFRLIDTATETVLARGLFERIGQEKGGFSYIPGEKDKITEDRVIPDHYEAVKILIETITDSRLGVIGSLDDIDAVGHRIVHGGDKFAHPVVITDEVIRGIEECSRLAPIHNPVNLLGIKACMKYMPDTVMVGVFDTSFHQTMPEEAYLYGIPYEYYERDRVRKYGFHGMSHEYVAGETAKMLGKDIRDTRIITCHLGNGASICAVKGGISVDTSMGFTPLAGIIMGTRSGGIDPEIVNYIATEENKSLQEVMDILNTKSGLYGVSGYLSSDVRDLTEEYDKGNEDAKRALNKLSYSITKFIGAYVVVLGGVDAITFTAGIGENSWLVRKLVCERLNALGVVLDEEKNKNVKGADMISAAESKVKIFRIPTDEEMSIARQVVKTLS